MTRCVEEQPLRPARQRTASAGVTVIIATRDRPQALAVCLDALRAGSRLPAEIVIVDQSRDHRTRQVVEPRARNGAPLCYFQQAASGLATAQNLAVASARCPIVAVTDDDCVPAPDWVARVEDLLGPGRSLDAVTGRVLPLGPEAPGQFAVASRTSTVRAEFRRGAMPWIVGSGNNFAVRRVWLDLIGGLDERLGPGSPGQGGVDMDLFYRLLRAGAVIGYEPELLVHHARTNHAGRLARRAPYGHGMGAGCSLWLRQKDVYALWVLGAWLLMRLRRLAGGAARGQWWLAREEVLVLSGTVRGLVHGLRLDAP